jgi:hypothetical protein
MRIGVPTQSKDHEYHHWRVTRPPLAGVRGRDGTAPEDLGR